jgi:hypothetical protein
MGQAATIDAILTLVALEALAITAYRRWSGRGPALLPLFANLAAGACLLLALRASLLGGTMSVWGPWLAVSFVAHLIDLRARFVETRPPA